MMYYDDYLNIHYLIIILYLMHAYIIYFNTCDKLHQIKTIKALSPKNLLSL